MERKDIDKTKAGKLFEGMVSISSLITSIEQNGNDRKILKIHFDKNMLTKKSRELSYLKRKSKLLNFEIDYCDSTYFEDNCIGTTHGGIVAECSERSIKPLNELIPKQRGFYVMVEGIEDPYNFGNALRSLYAAGVDAVIVSPRNWMGVAGLVCRASAGASELFDLYIGDGCDAAEYFKSYNYKVVCADMEDSVSVYEADLKFPIFLIIGGEKRGISSALKKKCDFSVRLDYGRDFKNALSAESATSIAAFEIFRRNRT